MDKSTRRSLWLAFGALVLFVVATAWMNIYVLRAEREHHIRAFQVFTPLMESIMSMDGSISSMLAAARGYTVTRRTEFLAQYDEANRDFETTAFAARGIARQPRDRQVIEMMSRHHALLRGISDQQIKETGDGQASEAIESMLKAARIRRTAYDFAEEFSKRERFERASELSALEKIPALTVLVIAVSALILLFGALAVVRVERSLEASIARQVKRTEAMIAGMADGVILVDAQGRVVFINPAGVQLLGTARLGVPVEEQAEVYGFRAANGGRLDVRENPAAQALSTGKPTKDATVMIDRRDLKPISVSMNAVPLHEDGHVTGVIVSFRDITERRQLEEEMQRQAEQAQILAEAGAFFTSNIDPVWVTQAIAERVAEVVGDWAAVILREPNTSDLRVAAIYHRDMASLGLAWSFVYRQPLLVGEGIFGQVVSSGYPSLISNLEGGSREQVNTYHAVQMKLSSLLILPLRSRRDVIGALVIGANDPDRQMNDQRLPLAELLAERAALAIENARLYIEQVEARRKVEDLSRLKDEFLSIASHELRTPVTSIKGYTQLAKTLIQENDLRTSAEYLDIALDQIDRMSRLILELLDVSRIETGRLEIRRDDINWSRFVESVVSRIHTAVADRRFHIEVSDEERFIEGDRDRLEQVVGNLLENAIKYSPDGSDIHVKVEMDGDRFITSIRDQGIGIPADELSQVFERFHRGRHVSSTNYGGLGLGLYISKQIIERHGGAIWVESKEGEGTTFFFALPTKARATQPPPSGEPSQAAQTVH